MELLSVKELFRNSKEYLGKEVTIGGWLRSKRDSKTFGFLVVNDGTYFEPIQVVYSDKLANFDEIKSRVNATGGYNNQTWVSWESTKEVNFNFSQGIFSKVQLAILGNAALESVEDIIIPKVESLELDENRQVKLKYVPLELFIYKKENGEPLMTF